MRALGGLFLSIGNGLLLELVVKPFLLGLGQIVKKADFGVGVVRNSLCPILKGLFELLAELLDFLLGEFRFVPQGLEAVLHLAVAGRRSYNRRLVLEQSLLLGIVGIGDLD